MRKAGVVWLRADGAEVARPAWQLWHEGAMYVVTGGQEQPLPELAAGRAEVTVRIDSEPGVVTWEAEVSEIPPGTPEWDAVVPKLHAKRLNAPDGELQPARWALESRVFRLAPRAD